MYLEHFGLKEKPFSIAPDPRFLFMSGRYREALSHLTYGVQEGGGFVLLTGEVGTGKTTVCRCLLQQLPNNTRLAFVLNPKLNSMELLATICDEFKIDYPENCSSLKLLTDKLSEYLLECYQQELNAVVMIDEAQNLQTEVLEQIRLLTNLETNQKKLLQIILVGQPELQEKLAQRNLRQLAQRITARYHLRPLNLKETMAYILHRVRIAGSKKNIFSRQSIEYLHLKTQGIPRLINTICDRALMATANHQKLVTDKKIMIQAVDEIMGKVQDSPESEFNFGFKLGLFKSGLLKSSLIGVGLLALISLAFWLGKNTQPANTQFLEKKVSQVKKVVEEKQQLSYQNINKSSINLEKPSLLEQLIGNQVWDTNGYYSMQYLFKLWQIDYSPTDNILGCDFAEGYGLKCSEHQGHWQQLREYNRPAILQFSAGLQGEFWGTLKSLNGLEAVIVIGSKETRVNLEKLITLWTGKFVFLWSIPPEFSGDIKVGDKGKSVAWLVNQLNAINYLDSESLESTGVFNLALKQKLIDYQVKRNIKADGIAGMQTLLKINQETLDGIPLLRDI